jgi:hypothetical protein
MGLQKISEFEIATTLTDSVVPIVQGGLNKKAPIALFGSGGLGYLVYTALLTQSGTNAPVATILQNTLGEDITWTRLFIGQYKGTKPTIFDQAKTVCILGAYTNGIWIDSKVDNFGGGDYQINLQTTINVSGFSDDLMINVPVEIRIYP